MFHFFNSQIFRQSFFFAWSIQHFSQIVVRIFFHIKKSEKTFQRSHISRTGSIGNLLLLHRSHITTNGAIIYLIPAVNFRILQILGKFTHIIAVRFYRIMRSAFFYCQKYNIIINCLVNHCSHPILSC